MLFKKEARLHDLRIECQTNFIFLGFCGLELQPCCHFWYIFLHSLCFQKSNKSSAESTGFVGFVVHLKHRCESVGPRLGAIWSSDFWAVLSDFLLLSWFFYRTPGKWLQELYCWGAVLKPLQMSIDSNLFPPKEAVWNKQTKRVLNKVRI